MARAAKYIAILGLYLATVAAAAGFVAARRYGPGAYESSAVAAALIWIVGSASLAIIASARTGAARINCALIATLVRMALPLAAVLYFTRSALPLAHSGVVALIAIHYLAGLILETVFTVRLVQVAEPGASRGRAIQAN